MKADKTVHSVDWAATVGNFPAASAEFMQDVGNLPVQERREALGSEEAPEIPSGKPRVGQ